MFPIKCRSHHTAITTNDRPFLWFRLNNAASGGFSGFSFPKAPRAIKDHRNIKKPDGFPFNPSERPFILFKGNTAHSTGLAVRIRNLASAIECTSVTVNTCDNQLVAVLMHWTDSTASHLAMLSPCRDLLATIICIISVAFVPQDIFGSTTEQYTLAEYYFTRLTRRMQR